MHEEDVRRKIAEDAAAAALEKFAGDGGALETTVNKSLNAFLLKLGIDTEDKEEMRLFKADLQHLRTWRGFMETARTWGVGSAVAAVCGLFFTALGAGIVHIIRTKG